MSKSSENKAIGRRLQEVRERKGLSQQAFARSLHVSLRTYQNYERGERPITKDLICALMERHYVDPRWLLTGKKMLIDPDLFKGIQQTLRNALSETGELNDEEFDDYTVTLYDEAASIDDPLLRLQSITSTTVLIGRERLKGLIKNLDFLIQNFEKIPSEQRRISGVSSVEDAQKKLKEARRRMEKFNSFLRSPSAQRIGSMPNDTTAASKANLHLEASSRQKNTKDQVHELAGRGDVRKDEKKKK